MLHGVPAGLILACSPLTSNPPSSIPSATSSAVAAVPLVLVVPTRRFAAATLACTRGGLEASLLGGGGLVSRLAAADVWVDLTEGTSFPEGWERR